MAVRQVDKKHATKDGRRWLFYVVLIGWTTGIIIDFFAKPCNFVKYIS